MHDLAERLALVQARITTLINVPLMIGGAAIVTPIIRQLLEDNISDICKVFKIEPEELEAEDDIVLCIKRHIRNQQMPVHEWLAEVDIIRPHNISIDEDGKYNSSNYGWGSYETVFVSANNLNSLVSMVEVCKANLYAEIYEQEQSM